MSVIALRGYMAGYMEKTALDYPDVTRNKKYEQLLTEGQAPLPLPSQRQGLVNPAETLQELGEAAGKAKGRIGAEGALKQKKYEDLLTQGEGPARIPDTIKPRLSLAKLQALMGKRLPTQSGPSKLDQPVDIVKPPYKSPWPGVDVDSVTQSVKDVTPPQLYRPTAPDKIKPGLNSAKLRALMAKNIPPKMPPMNGPTKLDQPVDIVTPYKSSWPGEPDVDSMTQSVNDVKPPQLDRPVAPKSSNRSAIMSLLGKWALPAAAGAAVVGGGSMAMDAMNRKKREAEGKPGISVKKALFLGLAFGLPVAVVTKMLATPEGRTQLAGLGSSIKSRFGRRAA